MYPRRPAAAEQLQSRTTFVPVSPILFFSRFALLLTFVIQSSESQTIHLRPIIPTCPGGHYAYGKNILLDCHWLFGPNASCDAAASAAGLPLFKAGEYAHLECQSGCSLELWSAGITKCSPVYLSNSIFHLILCACLFAPVFLIIVLWFLRARAIRHWLNIPVARAPRGRLWNDETLPLPFSPTAVRDAHHSAGTATTGGVVFDAFAMPAAAEMSPARFGGSTNGESDAPSCPSVEPLLSATHVFPCVLGASAVLNGGTHYAAPPSTGGRLLRALGTVVGYLGQADMPAAIVLPVTVAGKVQRSAAEFSGRLPPVRSPKRFGKHATALPQLPDLTRDLFVAITWQPRGLCLLSNGTGTNHGSHDRVIAMVPPDVVRGVVACGSDVALSLCCTDSATLHVHDIVLRCCCAKAASALALLAGLCAAVSDLEWQELHQRCWLASTHRPTPSAPASLPSRRAASSSRCTSLSPSDARDSATASLTPQQQQQLLLFRSSTTGATIFENPQFAKHYYAAPDSRRTLAGSGVARAAGGGVDSAVHSGDVGDGDRRIRNGDVGDGDRRTAALNLSTCDALGMCPDALQLLIDIFVPAEIATTGAGVGALLPRPTAPVPLYTTVESTDALFRAVRLVAGPSLAPLSECFPASAVSGRDEPDRALPLKSPRAL